MKKKMDAVNTKGAVQDWKALMFAYRAVLATLEYTLKEHDCSIAKFQILYFMYFEGGQRPIDIANSTGVSRANVHTFFKRMLADKLIRPVKSTGVRPSYLLTRKGEKLFEKAFIEHGESIEYMVDPMSKKMKAYLINLKLKAKQYNEEMRSES